MSSSPSSTPPPTPPPPPPPQRQQQYYFCYQCNRTISILPSNSGDLSCPHCHGGFLEEVDLPPSPPSLSLPFPFSPNVDPVDLSSLFSRPSLVDPPVGPNSALFDPFQFLHSYLHSMRQGGANIQFVIENANPNAGPGLGGPGLGGPGTNLGDYFFGPGLEQLIQQLAENDPNRYGTPPAAKSAVKGLPSVYVNEEVLNSDVDAAQCAVCMDEFELGAEAKQMPCKHVFHKDCIVPWLELHNSCPVCRNELPTDDPEYEQRRSEGGSGGGGVAEGSLEGDRMAERSFRISLPWPFRGASQGEGSNAASDDGENRNFGSETRQEDLD